VSREQQFLNALASRNAIRISVRAIVVSGGRTLVQRPTDDPEACYAFIGGEYQVGDTMAGRLRREFEEETNARVVNCEYRFVVETRFRWRGRLIHSLEHFFAVTLDREDIESGERHLSQHWLPLSSLRDCDLRPWIVRDVIAEGRLDRIRHLVVPLDGS
jgi:ADP-ribose pyrophosphatase YjhB (NUDIX family)